MAIHDDIQRLLALKADRRWLAKRGGAAVAVVGLASVGWLEASALADDGNTSGATVDGNSSGGNSSGGDGNGGDSQGGNGS